MKDPAHFKDAVHDIYLRGHGPRRSLQESSGAVLQMPRMTYHVIHNAANTSGWVSDAQLQEQHDTLRAAFSPYIAFGGWQRVNYGDDSVYSLGCSNQQTMTDFQADNYVAGDLNTYFLDCTSHNLFGYAYLPYSLAEDSPYHGVIIDSDSIDGDVCSGGCKGNTAVHEWGHAFGLLHTFESQLDDGDLDEGCDCTWGDLVDDTPPEASPAFNGAADCSAHWLRDTCTHDEINDPTSNFMDYSDDVCMSQFTTGQFYRMLYQLARTKPNLLGVSVNDGVEGSCFPGTVQDGAGGCVACGEGFYQDEFNATACKPCPANSDDTFVVGDDSALGGDLYTHKNQCYGATLGDSCRSDWLADGWCDAINNKAACLYDQGDCCSDCCDETAINPCGSGDAGSTFFSQCQDPTCAQSGDFVNDYELFGAGLCASFVYSPPTPAPTLESSQSEWEITVPVDAVPFTENDTQWIQEMSYAMVDAMQTLVHEAASVSGSLVNDAGSRRRKLLSWSFESTVTLGYDDAVDAGLVSASGDEAEAMESYGNTFTAELTQAIADGEFQDALETTLIADINANGTYAGISNVGSVASSVQTSLDATVNHEVSTRAPTAAPTWPPSGVGTPSMGVASVFATLAASFMAALVF